MCPLFDAPRPQAAQCARFLGRGQGPKGGPVHKEPGCGSCLTCWFSRLSKSSKSSKSYKPLAPRCQSRGLFIGSFRCENFLVKRPGKAWEGLGWAGVFSSVRPQCSMYLGRWRSADVWECGGFVLGVCGAKVRRSEIFLVMDLSVLVQWIPKFDHNYDDSIWL